MAVAAAAPRKEKWVLAHDHGFHAVARTREMWRYRRLIWFFARQAFEMLYARTQLGWIWVIIRPLAPIFVGAFVYGELLSVPSLGLPYFLFLLSGSVLWNCFDGPWAWGTRGLELHRHLVTKLYFPRMILPLATMSPGFAEPLVSIGVLIAALAYYRAMDGVWYFALTPRLLLAPVVVAIVVLFAFSLSLWTSIWNARARDVRYVLGYVNGFWLYMTPVIYPATQVPEPYRWVLWLNPMATYVETFKWTLFDNPLPPPWAFAVAIGAVVAAFVAGFLHFGAMESATADAI